MLILQRTRICQKYVAQANNIRQKFQCLTTQRIQYSRFQKSSHRKASIPRRRIPFAFDSRLSQPSNMLLHSIKTTFQCSKSQRWPSGRPQKSFFSETRYPCPSETLRTADHHHSQSPQPHYSLHPSTNLHRMKISTEPGDSDLFNQFLYAISPPP